MRHQTLVILLASAVAAVPARAAVSVFNFNGNLNADSGPATMTLFNGNAFGTFGTDTVGGQAKSVYQFPAATNTQGLEVTHNAPDNGGGAGVNEYTIGYDIKFTNPTGYASFFQTNMANANDADLFRNPAGGIGISGQYDGVMTPDQWHRVFFVFDLADLNGDGQTLYKYIDGALVGTQNPGGAGGRFALDPKFILLTDDDGETSPGALSSFYFEDRALTAGEVRAFGTPTTAGIAAVPEPSTLSLLGLGLTALIRRRKRA